MSTTSTTADSLRLRKASSSSANSTVMANTEELSDTAAEEMSREEIDKIDPFTYTPPFTTCGKIKVAINALWLAPLRFFLIVVPMIIAGTVMSIIALIGDRFDPDDPKPLGKWGRFVHEKINPYFDRWFLFGFGFHWIKVRGTPAPSSEAPIVVVAPHSSMLDIFIMVMFGTPTFVARSETRDTPLFGSIITRSVRAIYVSREDPDSRAKSAEEIRRRTLTKGAWPKVLIYPEGTTTNRGVLLKFKPGAFYPKLPVQPVIIKYNNQVDTTSWGGDGVGLIGSLFYTMCQFHNSLEVEFLPVYTPSQAEVDDHLLFANNVQKLIAKRVGIPAGDQSIEDLILMRHARSSGLPFSKGMVVYYKTYRETGIKVEEMKKWLTRFAAIDQNKDGFIEVDDLARFLKVPSDACLEAMFDSCKKDKEGKVSFPDYLRGLVAPARPLLQDDRYMQNMFKFFDRDNDGVVRFEDICQALPIQGFPTLPKSKKRGGKKNDDEDVLPSEMDLDQFKTLLIQHPEYVLLFHECQNAGISSPPLTESKNVDPPNKILVNDNTRTSGHVQVLDGTTFEPEHAVIANGTQHSSSSFLTDGPQGNSCRMEVKIEPSISHTLQVQVDVEA